MHATIDYSKSPAPAFDAVEDIKLWLGQAKWDQVHPRMSKITDVRIFAFYAELAGIQGFPIEAWWELIHGEGSWDKAWAALEAKEAEEDRTNAS
jgi:hypothetical protein